MKISEPFVAVILINSLPSEYTPLVQSLLTSFETLTLSRLYSLLNIEATVNSSAIKAETALSVNRSSGGKKYKKRDGPTYIITKDTVICSLGHPGHTDDNSKTKQWHDPKTYQDMMKSKLSSSSGGKPGDASQLANDERVNSSLEPDVDVSYYDTAFSATTTSLPTVMDTGASSHMFGDKTTFSSIHSTPTSHIGVPSKGGSSQSTSRGCVQLGALILRDVLYSNQLTGNLISIGRICDDGYLAVFRKRDGFILD